MISLAQNHVHTLTLPSFFKKEKRVEKSHQKSTQWTLTHPIQAEFLLETMRVSVHRNGLADFAVAFLLMATSRTKAQSASDFQSRTKKGSDDVQN